MDLLGALRTASQLGEVARSLTSPLTNAPWLRDEVAFFRHFGVEYSSYSKFLTLLSGEQLDLYERTLEVNPEAAVLWVMAMDEVGP